MVGIEVPEAVRYDFGTINDDLAKGRGKGGRYGLGAHPGLRSGVIEHPVN